MKQISFTTLADSGKKRKTKRKLEPHYPKAGKGRQLRGVEADLQMQHDTDDKVKVGTIDSKEHNSFNVSSVDGGQANDVSSLPPPLSIRQRMGGRDIHQHRGSSPLELLFDLTSVVAVAAVASRLHHNITGEHYLQAVVDFAFSFFAIWISWMNFSWFSSAYDTDDVSYRLATMLQIVGMLIMAAGLADGVGGQMTATAGYTVIRVALIWLWLRALREHPERSITCRRYALGLLALQCFWLARFLLAPTAWALPLFFVLVALELALPIWAEHAGETPWNPHHIADRYSLFTVILLGECMVGAANAIRAVLQTESLTLESIVVSFSVVGLISGLWWAYFLVPFAQALHLRRKRSSLWGYGHVLIFIPLFVLSGVLEVVSTVFAPDVSRAAIAVSGHEDSLPLLTIFLSGTMVVIFLATLRWVASRTTHRTSQSSLPLMVATLLAIVSMAAVAYGLPLSWGLAVLSTSPAAFITIVMRWRHLQPERFAVR